MYVWYAYTWYVLQLLKLQRLEFRECIHWIRFRSVAISINSSLKSRTGIGVHTYIQSGRFIGTALCFIAMRSCVILHWNWKPHWEDSLNARNCAADHQAQISAFHGLFVDAHTHTNPHASIYVAYSLTIGVASYFVNVLHCSISWVISVYGFYEFNNLAIEDFLIDK